MKKDEKKENAIKKVGNDINLGIMDRWKRSAPYIAISNFKMAYKKNKNFIYMQCGITYLLSIITTGYLVQIGMWFINRLDHVSLTLVPAAWFYKGKLLSLIIFLGYNYLFWYIGQRFIKNYTVDEARNIKVSRDGTYGTNSEMTEEEKEEALIIGDVWDIKWNIYGLDRKDDNLVYALKNQYGMNNNMSVTGTPGSGKSTGLVIPIIMQTVRREESLIITDPKGELYEQTSEMLRAHGYVVKLLNFDPKLMMHSDSCHFMKVIGKSTLLAHTFARTVIENITGGAINSDIWGLGGLNLLKGVILYVNMSVDIKEEDKTLATVYNTLAESSVEDLEEIFEYLPDDHPARKAFNIYSQGDKVVKGNTLTGLAIQLSVFQDETVCKLTSVDDIQFTDPGKKKCMYFVGSSDQEDSMDFLKALFFSLEYQELVSYADDTTLHPQTGKKLPVKVTMLLDEFPNCGVIPNFEKKLSTVRSRNIDTIFITQDLCQLQSMYPDNRWRTILNDCSSQMLLQTQDEETAKYFCTRSGTMTATTEGKRFSESDADIIKLKKKTEYTVTEASSERDVYTVGEIFTMSINELMLFISTHNGLKLRKYNYWSHPMYVEVGDDRNHQNLMTPITNHVPKWVRELRNDELEDFNLKEIPKQVIPEDGSRVTPINMDDPNSPARIAAMAKRNNSEKKEIIDKIKAAANRPTKNSEQQKIVSYEANEDSLTSSGLLDSVESVKAPEPFVKKEPKKVVIEKNINNSTEPITNMPENVPDSSNFDFKDESVHEDIEYLNSLFQAANEEIEEKTEIEKADATPSEQFTNLTFDGFDNFNFEEVKKDTGNDATGNMSDTENQNETTATSKEAVEKTETAAAPLFEQVSEDEINQHVKKSTNNTPFKKVGKYTRK